MYPPLISRHVVSKAPLYHAPPPEPNWEAAMAGPCAVTIIFPGLTPCGVSWKQGGERQMELSHVPLCSGGASELN